MNESLFAFVICFFRNHRARPDYEQLVWRCDRCGAHGPKLWMTGAWLVDWLRHGRAW